MLILSRKTDEEIIIGNEENERYIKIVVQKMVGGRVYLGFEAPDDVKIDRKEIWDAKYGNHGNDCQSNNVENVSEMHKGVRGKR